MLIVNLAVCPLVRPIEDACSPGNDHPDDELSFLVSTLFLALQACLALVFGDDMLLNYVF